MDSSKKGVADWILPEIANFFRSNIVLSNQYHPNHTHVTSVLNNTMTLQVNINNQKKEKNAEHSTYPISAPPLKIGSATVHLGVRFSLLLGYGLSRRSLSNKL